ncbi:MAG: PEGA domain-containing protein [Clostridiales bacterium]|nr:PEGA domain-containing protein [Clostridiales bacterium]
MPRKVPSQKWRQVVLLFAIALMCLITACSDTKSQSGTQTGQQSTQGKMPVDEDTAYDTKCQAIVKEINDVAHFITIFDLDTGRDITLTYNGGTDVTNQYGSVELMDSIEPGEIVDAYYLSTKDKLVKMQMSSEAWRYKGVDRMSFHPDEGYAAIGTKKYQYENNLLIYSDGEPITMLELNSEDELTVLGIGGKIYSIIVTKGHGYVRFSGIHDFIGGTLEIGARVILPIADPMIATVREGTYTLTMTNGELTGKKTITVAKNQEITIDMSEFQQPKEHIGKVHFIVTPQEASVYVNGTLVNAKKAVLLNYGKHSVIALCDGYEAFRGTLTVGEEEQYIQVTLAEEKEESSEASASSSEEPENPGEETDNETTDQTSKTEIKLDKAHKITVSAPAGAEVYFNGAYKGVAPVSFTKMIGSFTITLRKDGYETKSYTVEIVDDDQDSVLSFPDLELAVSDSSGDPN